jgi:hypothetical protein
LRPTCIADLRDHLFVRHDTNLFNFVIVGIGIIVGSLFATSVVAKYATSGGDGVPPGPMDYAKLFSVPMWMAAGCFALILLFYPGKKKLG